MGKNWGRASQNGNRGYVTYSGEWKMDRDSVEVENAFILSFYSKTSSIVEL